MAHVLILGGGFGGTSTAVALRERLGDGHRVTVVDRRPEFLMGLRYLWVLSGKGSRAEGTRSLDALRAKGIEVRVDEITRIDPATRAIVTSGGTIGADYLVVALGADLNTSAVPGFAEFNLYDPGDVERAAARIATMDRGRIVIGILGLPYKCPPAPYEAAFLVDDALRRRGVRGAVSLDLFTPQPSSLPVAGPVACAQVEGTLAAKRIGFHPGHAVERVEPGHVVFGGGAGLEYDLLLGVPPHAAPRVIRESGLGAPWIVPDPATLRTRWDRVFAIGDVTQIPIGGGQMLPKAGVFAEAQGLAVATEITAEVAGGPAARFDGVGYCFLESALDTASFIRGAFYARPQPAVEVTPPSADASAGKRAFERERLERWFGS